MDKLTRFHFVGIGGIGMSAIAQMLVKLGCTVTGSDIRATSITRQLEAIGIHIYYGHAASNLDGCHCVVYSSSIDPDNAELKEARKKRLVLKHRSQMLADLSADKWTAAISGAHGKSTTTSLLGWVYDQCGKKPTVIVGAKVKQLGGNFLMGVGPNMIIEADESDASFLQYTPDAIIVTNIDSDHLDYFGNIDEIYDKFRQFVQQLKEGGRWYGCAEDERIRLLLRQEPRGAVSYGFRSDCDYYASEVEYLGQEGCRFVLYGRGGRIGGLELHVYGRHNILNATAVCAMSIDQGLDFSMIRKAIQSYEGATRRFEILLNTPDLILVDDYAHHPTEIRTTLEAARQYSKRRLLVVFQPHRYSRTKLLEKDFSSCFDLADELIVTDIYAAGENPIDGISGQRLTEKVRSLRIGKTSFVSKEHLAQTLFSNIRQGDMVITMGAGDIGELAHEIKKTMSLSFEVGAKELPKQIRDQCKGLLKLREPLKVHTSIKIGGMAECWFEPEDTPSLLRAVQIARDLEIPVHVMGAGSNLLISDEGIEGLVIYLSHPHFKNLEIKGADVVAGAAVALSTFLQFLMSHHRGECEFLMGIPAQVGGAVMMNAGSGKKWIGSYLRKITVVDFMGQVRQIRSNEIPFGYRSSGLKNLIITEAVFRFPKVSPSITKRRLSEYSDYRRQTQDLRFASAGCMFKNPERGAKSAGQLIDEAGLKGTRVGQAQISELHGNFVVNLGGARQRDVLDIIRLVEDAVYEKFNVRLEREIKVLL